jgi:hypothetical protein
MNKKNVSSVDAKDAEADDVSGINENDLDEEDEEFFKMRKEYLLNELKNSYKYFSFPINLTRKMVCLNFLILVCLD